MTRCCLLIMVLIWPLSARAENWPEFRGPTGQGTYSGKGLPLEWSTTRNVAWKTKIPGKGWSSPILHEGKIYLTTAVPVEDKKDDRPKDKRDQSLQALCLDAATGKVLWSTEVFLQDGLKSPRVHSKNSFASPSPLTDGKHVFVHFGHEGTACLDLDGKVVWRNRELRYQPVHGNGGTPIFVDDKLVFSIDGSDKQLMVALAKSDGRVVWKTDRRSKAPRKFSFSTPLLIEVNGGKQIVSPASDAVIAYDVDGKEIWRARYQGYSVIPRPVFGHGMVFLSSGYDNPKLLAVRVDGKGDVTESHIAWTVSKGAPHTPSPLLVGDEVYLASDRGLGTCLDARTGKVHWQERLGEQYSASPTFANGKIYYQAEDGLTTVIKPGTTFEKLAESRLGEKTFASYAIADGAIYLRTETLLYRIQEK